MEGTHARITLVEGDLLAQQGLRIVHCANQFETHSDIVSKGSLLDKWKHYCLEKGIDIDSQIDDFCQRNNLMATKDESLQPYRTLKFPAGTLCPVMGEEEAFCLAAFCEPYNNKHVENLNYEQYLNYWESIWKNLSHLPIRRDRVSVALAGGHCVMVGSNYFTTQQKIAMIVHTFCKQMLKMPFCKHLNIVVCGPDVEEIDFEAWEKHLLPFLTEMSHLPFYWQPGERPEAIEKKKKSLAEDVSDADAFASFVEDYLEMVANLEKEEGRPIVQFVGAGKKVDCFYVHIRSNELRKVIDDIEHIAELRNYFGRRVGATYSRWAMLQLWGFLQEDTDYLGDLNRKNMMCLCLGCPEAVDDTALPERWHFLAPKFGSLFKYVGQHLSHFVQDAPAVLETLKGTVQIKE